MRVLGRSIAAWLREEHARHPWMLGGVAVSATAAAASNTAAIAQAFWSLVS